MKFHIFLIFLFLFLFSCKDNDEPLSGVVRFSSQAEIDENRARILNTREVDRLFIEGGEVYDLSAFCNLERVNGSFSISGTTGLDSIHDFKSLRVIEGDVDPVSFWDNDNLRYVNFQNLEESADISFDRNPNLECIQFPALERAGGLLVQNCKRFKKWINTPHLTHAGRISFHSNIDSFELIQDVSSLKVVYGSFQVGGKAPLKLDNSFHNLDSVGSFLNFFFRDLETSGVTALSDLKYCPNVWIIGGGGLPIDRFCDFKKTCVNGVGLTIESGANIYYCTDIQEACE